MISTSIDCRPTRTPCTGLSILSLVLLALVVAGGCSAPRDVAPGPSDATAETVLDAETHRAEIETWHLDRIEDLTADDSWLTLVGLFWLGEGENQFGTGPDNEIVFAPSPALAGLPATLGTLTVSHDALDLGSVRLDIEPGLPITVDGAAVSTADLGWDQETETGIMQLGSVTFYLIERGGDLGLRVKDTESQVRKDFAGLELYPVNDRWRFAGRFEPYDPPRKIPFPNVIGRDMNENSPGAVVFEHEGKEYRLDTIADTAEERLFVIVGDESNNKTTYGGGRYIYLDPPKADGTVIVDFNKLYNPPCVFTPYATCNLPPRQNRMPFGIEAGELAYEGGEH